jgi:UDP-N-acetylglucosamine:LPS N-acetylglucosamine transferase
VAIYKWLPNRFEYLKACDLAVGRAGHGTITQCMCYGKSIILIPTPNHTEQLTNAKQADSLGVAKIVLQEKLSKAKLLTCIQELLQPKALNRVSEVQKEALKYNGLENAVRAVVEVAQK